MTEQPKEIEVHIKYENVEKTFSAPPEEAWLLLSKFFNEFIPSFEVASRLLLSVDLQHLSKACEGLLAFSKEGANLLVSKSRLTDNETLLMWLLAAHLGYKLGLLANDVVSKEELQSKLGKSGKITSTRLGELVKSDMVAKTSDDKFRVTIFGVVQLQKDFLSKIRAKTNA